MSVEADRALVHRKLEIVEQAADTSAELLSVEAVQALVHQMEEVGAADEVAQDSTVKILATEAHATERVEAIIDRETIVLEVTVGDD